MRFRFVLALIAGMAAACSSSSSSPTNPSTPATNVSIVAGSRTLTTNAYSPNPVTIAVGGTVMWTNNDSIAHTSTGDNGSFDSGTIAPGATYSKTFSSAGSFAYHCTIHPGMVGTVVVH